MIKKTEDLSIFKKHPLNREVLDSNVSKIMNSIKIKNLLDKRPILVNEKMEIVDGQHRLEACKRLGISIYYEIEKTLEAKDIILLNANQKGWGLIDYIQFHARSGNKNYIDILELSETLKLPPAVMIRLISRTSGFYARIKAGNFQMPPQESGKIEEIKKIIGTYDDTITFLHSKLLGDKHFLNGDRFKAVLMQFLSMELVDLSIFLKKVVQRIDLVCQRATKLAYHLMWREIYNYRNTEPLP